MVPIIPLWNPGISRVPIIPFCESLHIVHRNPYRKSLGILRDSQSSLQELINHIASLAQAINKNTETIAVTCTLLLGIPESVL